MKNSALNSCSTHRSTRSSNNIRKKRRRRRGIFIHSFHLLCSVFGQLFFVGNLMIFFPRRRRRCCSLYSILFISVHSSWLLLLWFVLSSSCFRATFAWISVPFSWSSTAKCCFILWIFCNANYLPVCKPNKRPARFVLMHRFSIVFHCMKWKKSRRARELNTNSLFDFRFLKIIVCYARYVNEEGEPKFKGEHTDFFREFKDPTPKSFVV